LTTRPSREIAAALAVLVDIERIRVPSATLARRLRETRRFIQAVTGPRQVGKTTLVRQVIDTHHLRARIESADEPTP
jgi:predicted AAA+ superfamily ATPase